MLNILSVFLGGGIGATIRYLTTKLCLHYFKIGYPATFIVNITGCFLIGFIFGITTNKIQFSHNITLFLTTGLLGGLTTFSTFSLEGMLFLKEGKYLHFLIYTLSSIIIGFAAIYLGFLAGKN